MALLFQVERSARPQLYYSDTSPEEGGKIPESALLRVELNKIDSIGLGDPHAQQVSAALVNTPLPERVDPHGHGHGGPGPYHHHGAPHGGVPGGFGGFAAGFGGREGRLRKRRIGDREAAAAAPLARPRERARAGEGRGRAIDNRRAASVEGRAAFLT